MEPVTIRLFESESGNYLSFCLGTPTTVAELAENFNLQDNIAKKISELEAVLNPKLKEFESQLFSGLSHGDCMGFLPGAGVVADMKTRKEEFLTMQPEYEELQNLRSTRDEFTSKTQYEFAFELPYSN